MDFLDKIV